MKENIWVKEFYRVLGDNLRTRRKRNLKITQKQLAFEVGIDRTSLAKIESGDQRVPLHTLCSIARILKTDVASLLPAIEIVQGSIDAHKEILRRAQAPEGLNERQMDSIARAIDRGIRKRALKNAT